MILKDENHFQDFGLYHRSQYNYSKIYYISYDIKIS